MSDISKIQLASNVCDIKDVDARTQIYDETVKRLQADNKLSAYLALLGFGFDSCTVVTLGSGAAYDEQNILNALGTINAYGDAPVILAIYDGNYSTNDSSNPYGATVENNKILYGMGKMGNVQINSTLGSSTSKSTLCLKDSCALFNLFINGTGGEYTIHDDFHNEGSSIPQYRYIYNCEIYGSEHTASNVYGAGIKSNQHLKIENSLIYSFDNQPIRIHNWSNCAQDAVIDFDNVIIRAGAGFDGLRLSALNEYNGNASFNRVKVNIKNCTVSNIHIVPEVGNPSVNPFRVNCDTVIPFKCDVGAIDFVHSMPIIGLNTPIAQSLVGKVVTEGTTPNTWQTYAAYNDNCAAGFAYSDTILAIAGCLYETSIFSAFSSLQPGSVLTLSNGQLSINGTGKVVAYKDAQHYIHFDFR